VPVTRNRDGEDKKGDYDQTRGLKALSAPARQPLRTTGWVPHGIIVAEPRELFCDATCRSAEANRRRTA
jgi:hypothetical protein